MSLTESAALHVVFWIYLLTGATVFYWIEAPLHGNSSDPNYRIDNPHVHCLNVRKDNGSGTEILPHVHRVSHSQRFDEDSWDFSAALFLAMTISTTIGYGNYVPLTQTGKIFTIVYALIGIALAGLVLAATSSYLSSRLLHLYKRQLKERNEKKLAIGVAAVSFLVPGLLLFVFIPALIFSQIEEWSYLDGVYFSVVTLTTIGFGDIVPGQHGWFYKLAIINWIIIGTSYFAVIISFVSKAIDSKRLRNRIPAIVSQSRRTSRVSAAVCAAMGPPVPSIHIYPPDEPDISVQVSDDVSQISLDMDYVDKVHPSESEACLLHDAWVSALQRSQQWVLTGCYDNTIHLWNLMGENHVIISGHKAPVTGISWVQSDQESRTIFASVSHDQTLRFWSLDVFVGTFKCERVSCGHERSVECLAVDSDATLVATGGSDNILNIWSTEWKDRPLLTISGHRGSVSGLCWTDDGGIFSCSTDHTIKLWDVGTGLLKREVEGRDSFMSMSRSTFTGALIASSTDRLIRVYDPRSTDGWTLTILYPSTCVSSVCWSTCQDYLFVSGAHGGIVRTWDTRWPKSWIGEMIGHSDKILCSDWSDPDHVLTGAADNTVHIFKTH